MTSSTAAVLASGGVDSAALLLYALQRHSAVTPVYVRFGLTWESAELRSLRRQLRRLARPSLRPLVVLRAPVQDLYKNHWSLSGKKVPGYRSADAAVYLPGRNLLLLSQAGIYCALQKIPRVYLGTLAANPFADTRPPFFRALSRAVTIALGHPFQIHTPFRGLTKEEVVRRWPHAPFDLAFSCLNPKNSGPCGACNKCAEREKALLRPINRAGKI